MEDTVILEGYGQTVRIAAGELVGYTLDGHECIHQKGSPGWRNSDTEMFPIIGPTAAADFQVRTAKGTAFQDQHGLLREMAYTPQQVSKTGALFQKVYTAGTEVANSKYPEKSTVEHLHWPYDFHFTKQFSLTQNGLEIIFVIQGEEGMPYMLGYHPAFKLYTANPMVRAKEVDIDLAQILEVGNRALQVADCDTLVLQDKVPLQIGTRGFGHFMLWTEVTNMVCIEPITFYPYAVDQANLSSGFSYLGKGKTQYQVFIGAL